MDTCSYFIKDKALFGSYPTQETVELLEKEGVRCFIDLTNQEEYQKMFYNLVPYFTKYKVIKYPIVDRRTPMDYKSFAQLIIEICSIIEKLGPNEKIYLHCRGGHGRSGILVACIYCFYFGIRSEDALLYTSICHSNRKIMNEKWRNIGSPQGKHQKDFVHNFFRVLKYKGENYLSNFSNHEIRTEKGVFKNAYFALQSFRKYTSEQFIEGLKRGEILYEYVDNQNGKEWERTKVEYMYQVLILKFEQHPELKEALMNTGLRKLLYISKDDFWGCGMHNNGRNQHGILLCRLRYKFLKEDFKNSLV
jgi:predicted NAD-dependent protein-ADP-ribosyltransferase YbiA (DUF1768 family)/protein-tyrosine phosphatase